MVMDGLKGRGPLFIVFGLLALVFFIKGKIALAIVFGLVAMVAGKRQGALVRPDDRDRIG
jgi:uncharacterized membrane protein HdeD (DUF308 family)